MSQTMPIALDRSARAKALSRVRSRAPALSHEETVSIVEARLRAAGVLHLADGIAIRRNVSRANLLGRRKFTRICAAQRELWALLFGSLAPISLPELGYLVARDHSTVLSGLQLREREVRRELGLPSWKANR